MIRTKNCEELPKFTKITAKILSVIFFRIMHYVLKADNVQISLPRLAKNRKLVNEKDGI